MRRFMYMAILTGSLTLSLDVYIFIEMCDSYCAKKIRIEQLKAILLDAHKL